MRDMRAPIAGQTGAQVTRQRWPAFPGFAGLWGPALSEGVARLLGRSTCLGRHLRLGRLLGCQDLALTQSLPFAGYPQQQYPPQGGYPPQYGGPPPQQQARRGSSFPLPESLQLGGSTLTALCATACSQYTCSSRSRRQSRTGAAWRPGARASAHRTLLLLAIPAVAWTLTRAVFSFCAQSGVRCGAPPSYFVCSSD